MTVRKYWRRHPVQMRIVALLLLIMVPITTPIIFVVVYWRDIVSTFAEEYRDTWRALVRGE